MKNCPELEELLSECIGESVVGFFQQKKASEMLDVSVFTLVLKTNLEKKQLN